MVVRWDKAIIKHTADKLSSLFVHSAESRTDILEAVFYDVEGGAGSISRVPQSFYLSPAVTTISASGSLRTVGGQSHPLRLGERRAERDPESHLHQLAEHYQPCDRNTIWYADASRKINYTVNCSPPYTSLRLSYRGYRMSYQWAKAYSSK